MLEWNYAYDRMRFDNLDAWADIARKENITWYMICVSITFMIQYDWYLVCVSITFLILDNRYLLYVSITFLYKDDWYMICEFFFSESALPPICQLVSTL